MALSDVYAEYGQCKVLGFPCFIGDYDFAFEANKVLYHLWYL